MIKIRHLGVVGGHFCSILVDFGANGCFCIVFCLFEGAIFSNWSTDITPSIPRKSCRMFRMADSRHLDGNSFQEDKKQFYLAKIAQKSVDVGACRIWQGGVGGSDYPRMRVSHPHAGSTQFGVHQIVYSLHFNVSLDTPYFDVSHICHRKHCVKAEHLVYESKAVNSQRNVCVQEGLCMGHGDSPNCILPPVN